MRIQPQPGLEAYNFQQLGILRNLGESFGPCDEGVESMSPLKGAWDALYKHVYTSEYVNIENE